MRVRPLYNQVAMGFFLVASLLSVQEASAVIPTPSGGTNTIELGACSNPQAKTVAIYHINGVLTKSFEAAENVVALASFIKTGLPAYLANSPVCVRVSLQYNPTAGAKDAIEAAQLVNAQVPNWLMELLQRGTVSNFNRFLTFNAGLPTGFQKETEAYVLGKLITARDFVDQKSINTHAATYETDLRACRSVLLVPHSQGNQYTYASYQQLDGHIPAKDKTLLNAIRMVGVATPLADTRNDGSSFWPRYRWRTHKGDFVILGAHLLVSNLLNSDTLPRDTTQWEWFGTGATPTQWALNSFGHKFTGYLQYSRAKGDILTDISEQLLALPAGGCPQFDKDQYVAPATQPAPALNKATITFVRSSAVNSETVYMDTDNARPLGEGRVLAIPGQDYQSFFGVPVSFAKDQTTASVQVTILRNPSRTTKREVPLILSQLEGGSPLGAKITATLEIPPDTSQVNRCIEASPNLHAEASVQSFIYPAKSESQTQPNISLSVTLPQSSASATGAKGSGTVNSSSSLEIGTFGDRASASIEYQDQFMVTSTGKSGNGEATLTVSGSASMSANCPEQQFALANGFADVLVSDNFRFGIGYVEQVGNCKRDPPTLRPTSASIPFTYGVPTSPFHVKVRVASNTYQNDGPGASVQASASIGYSVTVQGDPDATVTWCRATQ